MESSWSINDLPPDEGEEVIKEEVVYETPKLTRKEKEAIRFETIRHRKNRKGRGARRRAGEKKWATKGK